MRAIIKMKFNIVPEIFHVQATRFNVFYEYQGRKENAFYFEKLEGGAKRTLKFDLNLPISEKMFYETEAKLVVGEFYILLNQN